MTKNAKRRGGPPQAKEIKPPQEGERVWYVDPSGIEHQEARIERVNAPTLEVNLRYGDRSTLAENVPHSTAPKLGTWCRPGKRGRNASTVAAEDEIEQQREATHGE